MPKGGYEKPAISRTYWIPPDVVREGIDKCIIYLRKNGFLKSKSIVYYHRSDFVSLDEYLDLYSGREPISLEEARNVDWDNEFLDKLSKWKPRKVD